MLKRFFSQSHFSIDKMVGFYILDLISEQDLVFPEGGGGWRKTFKSPTIQIRIFLLKVRSVSTLKSSL